MNQSSEIHKNQFLFTLTTLLPFKKSKFLGNILRRPCQAQLVIILDLRPSRKKNKISFYLNPKIDAL